MSIRSGFRQMAERASEASGELPIRFSCERDATEPYPVLRVSVDPQTEVKDLYFIQSLLGGPVKIGVARNVAFRLARLSASSPIPLKVLFVVRGGEILEKKLHRNFGRHRLHGEWFEFGESIGRWVRSVFESASVPALADEVLQAMNTEFTTRPANRRTPPATDTVTEPSTKEADSHDDLKPLEAIAHHMRTRPEHMRRTFELHGVLPHVIENKLFYTLEQYNLYLRESSSSPVSAFQYSADDWSGV